MAEQTGEKTEQPTPHRLEDAIKKGQFPRSQEVQTVFVLFAALISISLAGGEIWRLMVDATVGSLSHLYDTPLSVDSLQGYAVSGALLFLKCTGPVVLTIMLGGLLAGSIQSRFQTASEAVTPDWERVNPVEGFKRVFSVRSLAPTVIAFFKFVFIIVLLWSEIQRVLNDPIFATSVSTERLGAFLAQTSLRIILRVALGLLLIAAADYAYQWWRTQQDMLMTRDEVKEDMKNSEGNPRTKAARRRRRAITKAKALAEVPKADVIVTNPTHIAVALRYDRKTMRAPKVVAKGIRLNAQRIREIAQQHQIPMMENKPLARMLFKHGRVGGEIPAHLYAAVAEVLAWVYRMNRYRYYTEQNQV